MCPRGTVRSVPGVRLQDASRRTPLETPMLVTTDWLADHLDDPTITVVEVDEDTDAYARGHIPGAVAVNWTHRPAGPAAPRLRRRPRRSPRLQVAARHHQRHDRRPVRRQQQLVRRLRVLVLQGLRARRRPAARRRPQGSGSSRAASSSPRRPRSRRRRLRTGPRRTRRSAPSATRSATRYVGNPGAALVDVRSPEEYRGERLAPDHLPNEAAQRPGPHPRRREHPVGQGRRPRHRPVPARGRRSARCTAAPASPPTRTSSRTAASASGPRTPGSCCTSCSATRGCATTTAPGPSGARWSASRSSADRPLIGLEPPPRPAEVAGRGGRRGSPRRAGGRRPRGRVPSACGPRGRRPVRLRRPVAPS